MKILVYHTGHRRSGFQPLIPTLAERWEPRSSVLVRPGAQRVGEEPVLAVLLYATETASPIQDLVSRASAFDDAVDPFGVDLKTFDGLRELVPQLKNRMLNIDSAFDRKGLDSRPLPPSCEPVEGIDLIQDAKTWIAYLQSETVPKTGLDQLLPVTPRHRERSTRPRVPRRILRKKRMATDPGPASPVVLRSMRDLGPLPKSGSLSRPWLPAQRAALTTADVQRATQLASTKQTLSTYLEE